MSDGTTNAEEDERVLYRTRLHWAIILGPALLMILSGISIPRSGLNGVLLLAFGTMWGVFSSISYEKSEFLVTARRVLIRPGFPWRKPYDLLLSEIEEVNVYQPSLGKMLNFGKITIRTRSGRRVFRLVADPYQLGAVILQNRPGRGEAGNHAST